MSLSKTIILACGASLFVVGCAKEGDFDSSGGINAVRSACPAVAVPTYTGDMTLFSPENSRDSRAIDVVANITNLRTTCADVGDNVVAKATFDVQARRSNPAGAREVVVPYFATVLQGGRFVVSKRVANIVLRFEDGQYRAAAVGAASATVNRSAATLPPEIEARIRRKRKAGDFDAALDPMADPEVKAALARASFELLIGFQLTQSQLQYNATR